MDAGKHVRADRDGSSHAWLEKDTIADLFINMQQNFEEDDMSNWDEVTDNNFNGFVFHDEEDDDFYEDLNDKEDDDFDGGLNDEEDGDSYGGMYGEENDFSEELYGDDHSNSNEDTYENIEKLIDDPDEQFFIRMAVDLLGKHATLASVKEIFSLLDIPGNLRKKYVRDFYMCLGKRYPTSASAVPGEKFSVKDYKRLRDAKSKYYRSNRNGPFVKVERLAEISNNLEQAILDKNKSEIVRMSVLAWRANCEFPRAAGLAALYCEPKVAEVVFDATVHYEMQGKYWPDKQYQDPLHLVIHRDGAIRAQLFLLLPLLGIYHPDFYGDWGGMDLARLESVTPASADARKRNIELMQKEDARVNGKNRYVPHVEYFMKLYGSIHYMLHGEYPEVFPFAGLIDRPEQLVARHMTNRSSYYYLQTLEYVSSFDLTDLHVFVDKLFQAADIVESGLYQVDNAFLLAVAKAPDIITRIFQEKRTVNGVSRIGFGRYLIDHHRTEVFSLLLDRGIFNTKNTRNKLLEYAREKKSVEIQAVLIDYIAKTTDPMEEAEKQMKKEMAQLNAKPGSVLMMKTLWSWKKNEDGGLTILAYKGPEQKVVTVPEKIGKTPVTRIGKRAFNTRNGYYDLKWMKSGLEQVWLPESITEIHGDAFDGCAVLKQLVLPGQISKILWNMFYSCKELDLWITSPQTTIDPVYVGRIAGVKNIYLPEGSCLLSKIHPANLYQFIYTYTTADVIPRPGEQMQG